jgi:formylglycine-generating enzyme required for sulfatase activity
MEIYLHQDGERTGPFTLEHVQVHLDGGKLSVFDPAWFEGCSDWVTVRDLPGIMLPGGDHLLDISTVPPFEAYQGDEPYVFISYAHKDVAMVYEEIEHLRLTGVKIWYDEGIDASNEWPDEIANAVIGCTVFLVFVSPRATQSVNCRNEINLALNKSKPFLAIHLEETELPPGLELRMGDLQAILRYKLPVELYQKKTKDSLAQLLGKKPAKSRTRPPVALQTEVVHEPENISSSLAEPVSTAQSDVTKASPKPRRKGLILALATVLLIACGTLGYLFLGDDDEATKENLNPDTTATFTPGQPWTVLSVDLEMIWCEPGTFMMGSPESEEGRQGIFKGKKTNYDETRHQVTLTKGFYLGKYEVTQTQWKKVMGSSPSKFFGERRPVENVTWTESVRFCQELTLLERKAGRIPDGWEYTLPTEAQWEYACRAGTTTVFSFGDSLSSKQADFRGTLPYSGAEPRTSPSFLSNWANLNNNQSLGSFYGVAVGPSSVVACGIDGLLAVRNNSTGVWIAQSGGDPDFRDIAYRNGQFVAVGESGMIRTSPAGSSWTVRASGTTQNLRCIFWDGARFLVGGDSGTLLESADGQTWSALSTGSAISFNALAFSGSQYIAVGGFGMLISTDGNQWSSPSVPPPAFSLECAAWTGDRFIAGGLSDKIYQSLDGQTWTVVHTLPESNAESIASFNGKTFIVGGSSFISAYENGVFVDLSTPLARSNPLMDVTISGSDIVVVGLNDVVIARNLADPFLERTTEVGSYQPNPWGFYDMHGNVSEWCSDWVHTYPTGTLTDPMGPASGSYRVLRGGSWGTVGPNLRSAMRGSTSPSSRRNILGFRVGFKASQ